MTNSFPTLPSTRIGTHAKRNYQYGPRQIIDPTAKSVIGVRLSVFRRIDSIAVGIGKIIAQHAWADTANVKAPHLRFTKEEAIRQANLVDLVAYAIVALLFQRVNITGLATQRENETSAHLPEIGRASCRERVWTYV